MYLKSGMKRIIPNIDPSSLCYQLLIQVCNSCILLGCFSSLDISSVLAIAKVAQKSAFTENHLYSPSKLPLTIPITFGDVVAFLSRSGLWTTQNRLSEFLWEISLLTTK